MATVIELSTKLGNLISDYITKRTAIQTNKDISADYATRQMNELYRNTLPEAERLVKQLVGDVTDDGSGRYILSEQGAVWAEMSAAEQRQADGKQAFLGKRYKNAELIPIIQARVNGTVARCMSANEFITAYEQMSADEQAYAQDMGDALFAGRDTNQWQRAIVHLRTARKASENAVFQPLEAAVGQTVTNAWEFALPTIRKTADEFGRESWYLGEVQKGILARRVGFGYEVDRKAWGVHHANSSNITKYQAPSDIFPKARKVGNQ